MKEFGGWSQGTQMFSTYIHVSNESMDRRILEANGIVPTEETPGLFSKSVCPGCGVIYLGDVDFCSKCGMALKAQAAAHVEKVRNQADELLGKLLEDPLVQSYLLKRMKKLKLHPALSALASSAPEPRQEERV
jgi:hypothetical protein